MCRYSGEPFVWVLRLFETLSEGIELVDTDSSETLVTTFMEKALIADAHRRIARSVKRQTAEYKKKTGNSDIVTVA